MEVWTLILSKTLDKIIRETHKLVCTRSIVFPRSIRHFLRDWDNQWPMRHESSARMSLSQKRVPFDHTSHPKAAPRAPCESLWHEQGSRSPHWHPLIRIPEPNSASLRRVTGNAVLGQRR